MNVLTPDRNLSTASLNATTSTAAISIGPNKTFSVAATGPVHYVLGTSAVGAADANDPVLPTGRHFLRTDYQTHIRIYNPGAGAITYSVVDYYNTSTENDVVFAGNEEVSFFDTISLDNGVAVADLPATPRVGMIQRVTDADTPVVGDAVVGSAAAAALVWYSGSQWTVIGV